MNHRIEEKPALDVVGWALKTTTVDGRNMKEIPEFWGRCHAEGKVAALAPHAGPFGLLGLCTDFDARMEEFTYVIGVIADSGTPGIPPGTQTVRLPAAGYAVFTCVGAMPDAIQDGWHQIMAQWMPHSDYEQSSPVNFERYPSFPEGDERGDPESPRCVTEIWIPVRKIDRLRTLP